MGAFRKTASIGHTLTPEPSPTQGMFKTSSVSPELREKIAFMGLRRVAGNLLCSPASKDYWAIKNNKLVRITVQEIEDGTLAPAVAPDMNSHSSMFDFTF